MCQIARDGSRAGISRVVVGTPPALAAVRRMCVFSFFSELSPLLDDHGMFHSMHVLKRIHLRPFDVRKGPGRWEGRVRYGNDIYFRCSLSIHAPLHKSPFSMYFTPSKVSRLNKVNTLLIVMSFTFLAQLESCAWYDTLGVCCSG